MQSQATSPTTTIHVDLAERGYEIHIGTQLIRSLPAWVSALLPKSKHAVLIHDQNLANNAEQLASAFESSNVRCSMLSVPSGETSKSLAVAEELWSAMVEHKTDRGSFVIALGGGVVGDLAGFVASTYARGLPLVALPTTLLSQVDSSVGGKTGINLPQAKNMVGTFWQPSLVVIDMQTLDSLPTREFQSGLAEVVKYGVILLPELFEYLEENSAAILAKRPAVLQRIIADSCRAKASVVQQDERETTGLRAILNYGHTFAHAIESIAGYGRFLHGEAVSIGMHMAAQLACTMGRIDEALVIRQRKLLEAFQLPIHCDEDPERLWEAMQHDKKVVHGKLRFILPNRLGHVELVPDVDKQLVLAAMKEVG